MICERCGADRLVLTFAPDRRDPAGLLCLACGGWRSADPVVTGDRSSP
jgi:hypothetical protein